MPSFSSRTSVMKTWNAGQRIFDVLAQAHKHVSEFEDQDRLLQTARAQPTPPPFANLARAAYLKHDASGYPLPDPTKGMIFLRQAKISEHLEDHIKAKTNGSRNFSDLLDAIQILARRPMSQVSSSFPSYDDEWDDSTNATEYYDIDDHNAVDNDGDYDEYDEFEDHGGEWIDMSGILEDLTFEEPDLACTLVNLQKGKKGSSKGHRRGKKDWSKGESRDILRLSTKEAGKGGRPENYKQVRLKLQSDRLNRGWRDQSTHGTNKVVVAHSWYRWMISSLAPVVSNVESWGISRRTALRTTNRPQVPRLSSVVWFATTPAPFILETIRLSPSPWTWTRSARCEGNS